MFPIVSLISWIFLFIAGWNAIPAWNDEGNARLYFFIALVISYAAYWYSNYLMYKLFEDEGQIK